LLNLPALTRLFGRVFVLALNDTPGLANHQLANSAQGADRTLLL
jgi:hypothetical protein